MALWFPTRLPLPIAIFARLDSLFRGQINSRFKIFAGGRPLRRRRQTVWISANRGCEGPRPSRPAPKRLAIAGRLLEGVRSVGAVKRCGYRRTAAARGLQPIRTLPVRSIAMGNPMGTVPPKNTGISIGGFPNPANLHGVYSLSGKGSIHYRERGRPERYQRNNLCPLLLHHQILKA